MQKSKSSNSCGVGPKAPLTNLDHNSLPPQKRLDALAEIPKRLGKMTGSTPSKGVSRRTVEADVESARLQDVDDARMLIALGVAGGSGDGVCGQTSARKRSRPEGDS